MNVKAFLALLLLFSIQLPSLEQTKAAPKDPPQTQKQTDDKDDVVRITTNLVQVDAVVTKDGKPVTNSGPGAGKLLSGGRRYRQGRQEQ